jgi:hypothetical protein
MLWVVALLTLVGVGGTQIAAAQPAPLPTPTPLKVIGRVAVTPICALLHLTIAQSVRGVLENDVAIAQAGDSVADMDRSIAASEDPIDRNAGDNGIWTNDPNPGVALADLRLIALGGRLVRSIDAIERALADPQLAANADPQVTHLRTTLERIVEQQRAMTRIVFAIANSYHPAYLESYDVDTQREIEAAMRNAPTSAGMTNPMAALANIAIANISVTHRLEDVAATDVTSLVRRCR